MKYPKKVSEHIVSWIDNYINKSGVKGIVVGVSGGVDSALTSTLCAETGQNVLCLEMPIYQNKDQVSRSEKHIDWLKSKYTNVTSKKIELDKTFESFVAYGTLKVIYESAESLRMRSPYRLEGTLPTGEVFVTDRLSSKM